MAHSGSSGSKSSVPTATLKYSTSVTSAEVVVTFNQPVQLVRVISGSPTLLAKHNAQSATFRRSSTSNERVTISVTPDAGHAEVLTVRIPKSALPAASAPAGLSKQTNSKQTTSTSEPPPKGTPAKVVYFGPASDRRVYITIDDGWKPSQRVLHLMQTQHVPITTFLIQNAAVEHLAYWKAFVKAGGVIEDHTISHPMLTKVPFQEAVAQWKGPISTYPKWFGQTPTLGRPPYGGINPSVAIAAHDAGLQEIVMWSAEFNPTDPSKGLETWNHKQLSPGEIIILHWQPGIYNQIETILALCKKLNLHPAPLVLSNDTSTTGTTSGTSGTE